MKSATAKTATSSIPPKTTSGYQSLRKKPNENTNHMN